MNTVVSMTASYDRVSSLQVSKPYLFQGHSGCCPELFLQVQPLHIFLFVFTPLWLTSQTPTALLRDFATSLRKAASLSQIRHQHQEIWCISVTFFCCVVLYPETQYRLQVRRNFIQWMFLLWAFLHLLLESQYTRVVFESTNWFWMATCTSWVFGESFPQLRWYTALASEGRKASGAWIWAASLQPKHTPGPGCEGPHLLADPKWPPTWQTRLPASHLYTEMCRVGQ